ncbi:hypothetical protein GOODEAATRI_011149, partial [Goodea atripinnis]
INRLESANFLLNGSEPQSAEVPSEPGWTAGPTLWSHGEWLKQRQPGQRTADDLEIIYDELLHIKALSHLSNTGVVCTLHEGDDFGKLALVTDSPRAASIVLREDNCHFLRVDKEDFNRILRFLRHQTCIPANLLFTFNPACTYHMASPPGSEQERLEYMLNSKRRALILSLRWANTHTYLLQEEPAAISFLEVNMRRIFLQVLAFLMISAWSDMFFLFVSEGAVRKCVQ